MPDPDARPTKPCPDCAESVLAEARVCRYCGYRFDSAESPSEGGLMSLLVSRRQDATLPQVLTRWGIVLEEDEDVEAVAMSVARLRNTAGFVVVTEIRFLFVDGRHSRRRPAELLEVRDLADLLRVHVVRRRLRRLLALEWRDGQMLLDVPGRDLERLQAVLAPHALVPGDRS